MTSAFWCGLFWHDCSVVKAIAMFLVKASAILYSKQRAEVRATAILGARFENLKFEALTTQPIWYSYTSTSYVQVTDTALSPSLSRI